MLVRDHIQANLDDLIQWKRTVRADVPGYLIDSSIDSAARYARVMEEGTPRSCEYGTSLELFALAYVRRTNVVVYVYSTADDDGSLRQFMEVCVDPEAPTMCLLYGGMHYDALLPTEEYFDEYVEGGVRMDITDVATDAEGVASPIAYVGDGNQYEPLAESTLRDASVQESSSTPVGQEMEIVREKIVADVRHTKRKPTAGKVPSSKKRQKLNSRAKKKRRRRSSMGEEERQAARQKDRERYANMAGPKKARRLRQVQVGMKRLREASKQEAMEVVGDGPVAAEWWDRAGSMAVEGSDDGENLLQDEARNLLQDALCPRGPAECPAAREDQCDNCWRRQFDYEPSSVYHLRFSVVPTYRIRRMMNKMKWVRAERVSGNEYNLCQECANYLCATEAVERMTVAEKRHLMDWENTWPSFFRELLFGGEVNEAYDGREVWQFVPESVRPYWTAVMEMNSRAFAGCTVASPPSFFEDQTKRVTEFWADIKSYELDRWLHAFKEDPSRKPIVLPDVLCPWGCTEFSYKAAPWNMALFIQHHLRKAVVRMPQTEWYEDIRFVQSSRQDYIRKECRYDALLLNGESWPILPSVMMIPGQGLMVLTCQEHADREATKHLYLHPPRKPDVNLSAVQSDQLSPCVVQPRTCRPMRAGVYNTTFSMTTQQSSYSGVDSMNISTEGNFSKPSVMLGMHEALSIAQRDDMDRLASLNVEEGLMPAELARSLREKAQHMYSGDDVGACLQGATYVPLADSMKLQIDAAEENTVPMLVLRENKETRALEEVIVHAERSWPPVINILQMEDSLGWGYPFAPIMKYARPGTDCPVMMLWSLAGCLVGCKELWAAVDGKATPFHRNGWEGHMLTHLQSHYMKHETIAAPTASPFKSSEVQTVQAMLGKIEPFMPEAMRDFRGTDVDDSNRFYKFGIEYWRRLFPANEFPSVSISPTVDDAMLEMERSSPEVAIVVEAEQPAKLVAKERDRLFVGRTQYEARVVIGIKRTSVGARSAISTSNFEGVRFVRHGKGFSSWWKQERRYAAPMLMTQCQDAFEALPRECFAYITVYAKVDQPNVEQYKLDFHRTLGGQIKVFCQCNDFPLIMTGRRPKEKRPCMMQRCLRRECYVCSDSACTTRVCKRCFDKLAEQATTTRLKPIPGDAEGPNEDVHSDEDFHPVDVDDATNSTNVEEVAEEDSHPFVTLRERVIQRVRALGEPPADGPLDEFFLDDYLATAPINPLDTAKDMESAPMATNAGDFAYTILPRSKSRSVPCHVLLNQVGTLCQRYNTRIKGTQAQIHFIQKMVSTICGTSFPLLYPMGCCFPRHFYARATHDSCAILGAPPLSCYTNQLHRHGIASTLSTARNLLTHASSSTSTCHNFTGFCHDIETNQVASGVHSEVINRQGFAVDLMSPHGLSVRDQYRSELTESVDSHQAAIDLAAATRYHAFDWFLTFTCCQDSHPGISHLHTWKESMEWTKAFPRYQHLSAAEKAEVKRSFEQAYGSLLTRCWMEVSRFWLDYITYSISSVMAPTGKRPLHSYWRYEFQPEQGNEPHIHGLLTVSKEMMDNAAVREKIYDLQKCAVCDLIPASEVPAYIEQGLLDSRHDWVQLMEKAGKILTHLRHTDRCLARVSDESDGPEAFKCRKINTVRDGIHPLQHDFVPFRFQYSPACLAALEDCGLYQPPTGHEPAGKFGHQMFAPTRHIGIGHPGDEGNMSPCIAPFFAATRSMQNAQVLTGTNGVARYIAKYVTELDQGNRATVWADNHTGAAFHVEDTFIHNTKVARSRMNEESAFQKSRGRGHPAGRAIAFTERLQQLLGYPEVLTSFDFCHISTQALERRPSTKVELDEKGNLVRPDRTEAGDAITPVSKVQVARRQKLGGHRQLTDSQQLLYRHNSTGGARYDRVTQFGLRPVELLQLFPRLGDYYRWFHVSEESLPSDEIVNGLAFDVRNCLWIDAFGRQVLLRRNAFEEVMEHLEGLDDASLSIDSRRLRAHLLSVIAQGGEADDRFVLSDGKEPKDLPIPVFSSVTPYDPKALLLHMMLTLGEYETELDFSRQPSIRESLIAVKLIGGATDEASLREYSRRLLRLFVTEILPVQPATLRRIDGFVVAAKRIFDGVLITEEIPTMELPPCLLTQLYDSKDAKLKDFWADVKSNQLESIYRMLGGNPHLPSPTAVASCNKERHLEWDPLDPLWKSPDQSDESYREQRLVVSIGKRLVDKYCLQFGTGATTFTKNMINWGVPGSGKTHIDQYVCLYALSRGLNVMPSAIMAARATALGGIHVHRLFGWPTKMPATPYRLAEMGIEKLKRKSHFEFLHALLTMDVLFFDEIGQLSAEQFAAMDIQLQQLRQTKLPFGGVLIVGTMDPAQFGAITGLPFMLSSYLLTDFIVVRMRRSVRAHADPDFQEIQNITRMSPAQLLSTPNMERRFKELVGSNLRFIDSWDHPLITPNVQQMFARRKPAKDSSNKYINDCQRRFDEQQTPYVASLAEDFQQRHGSRAEFVPITDVNALSALNNKLKEPPKLLFWRGAAFQATVNDTDSNQYNQSQLMALFDVPSEETVRAKAPITLLVAPKGVNYVPSGRTEEELLAAGWKPVTVSLSRPRLVTTRGVVAYRRQYPLAHIGASTINKQTGNTIEGSCAIEMITSKSSPWSKEQIVVMLSRTHRASDVIIVGEKEAAIDLIWNIITTGNQWTPYVDAVLDRISINALDTDVHPDHYVVNYAETYPFRTCDIVPPLDSTGFVYYLISVEDVERGYVGQADNLGRRLMEHNSGYGAIGTADPMYRPYFIAAYLCGLGEMDEAHRMHLERRWRQYNLAAINSNRGDVYHRIMQGQRVMQEYNADRPPEDHIRFVVTVKRRAVGP